MKYLALLLGLSSAFYASSQLQTAYSSAQTLVQDVFATNGLITSNYLMQGAVGNFVSTNTVLDSNFGITDGIILTTGTIENTIHGPHGPNDSHGAGIDNGLPGDPTLTLIADTYWCDEWKETHNASWLAFNFIPVSDSLEFEFVFGSEEYGNISPQFNDLFVALLKSVGGIEENIALLPNGSIVSVHSINPDTNSVYYTDNGDGFSAPYNADPQYIQYDGYTTPIKIKVGVTPFQEYSLRLMIADTGDQEYDSGVFLTARSFNAVSTPQIEANSFEIVPNPVSSDLNIELPSPETIPYVIVDALGHQYKNGIITSNKKIDVSDLTPGSYFFVLQTEKPIVKTFQKQ